MTRNIYIDNIELEEALSILKKEIKTYLKEEYISVKECNGRIVAKSVFADRCSPSYSASAMDGILLFSNLTDKASEVNPIYLEEGKDFTYINTGEPIDYNCGDCVIMIEEVIPAEMGKIKLLKSGKPWDNIRGIGEDIIQGEMILKKGHRINPQDLAALISANVKEVSVLKKPTVAIIPTGNEVIDIFKEEYQEGKVVDSNSYMFSAMIEEWGGTPMILSKSSDDVSQLKTRVLEGVEKADIVILNAGSSAGSKDFSKSIIMELGRVILHGIAIKPGKPVIIGEIENKLILGIPGYPVSAFLSLEIFLKPIIELLCENKKEEVYATAELSQDIPSSLKYKEYLRVTLSYIGDKLIATPLPRGAGITMSLVRADGILTIPKNSEGVSKGSIHKVRLLKPLHEIEEYLISVGSHDVIMEQIADKIKLVSTHAGSFGGILALKNNTTHIAPIHILHEESGKYNTPIVEKYFDKDEVVLIKGIKRLQGILVEKENPLNIKTIFDLTNNHIVFANRQRGAGTRILLDFLLTSNNISSENIKGYNREFSTHLEVAMAIKSGVANVGLGIKEAATITNLDFIPLKDEEYDFLVHKKNLNLPVVEEFINFLKSEYFKELVSKIDGYTIENSGEIVVI